jgi:hypothetical protein
LNPKLKLHEKSREDLVEQKDENIEWVACTKIGVGQSLRNGSLNGVPESWHHTDEGTLARIDEWISLGHPDRCCPRLSHILSLTSPNYLVTAQRLTAHCVREHDEGVRALTDMYRHYFAVDPEKVSLADSVLANEMRLVDEVLVEWKSLGKEGRHTVYLIARYAGEEQFARLWKAIWNDGLAAENQQGTAAVFAASAFLRTRSSYSANLIERSLETLSELILDDVIMCLIWSQEIRPHRDRALNNLLKLKGSHAARVIINHSHGAAEVPPCLPSAAKMLLDSEPGDPAVPIGVGLSLHTNPDFAIPIIVDWVNTSKTNHHYDSFFRWKVEQSDQRNLFRALALDAIKRDPVWHHPLAQIHCDLITQAQHAVEWIEETFDNDQSSRYNAGLVVAYLSELRESATPAIIHKLTRLGRTLHEKYGSRNEKDVLAESNLTDPNLPHHNELAAIALAKDVVFPTKKIDTQEILRCLKQLPFTYRALGSTQLDAALVAGNLLPYAEYYATNAELELEKLEKRLNSGEIDGQEFTWTAYWPNAALSFRRLWESRFKRISEAGISPPTRRLREDRNVWNEMRILAQLVEFFEVKYEPTNIQGMGTRRPEFVLRSPDGDAILEVATISAKPEDVREGAKMSTGGTTKKTLQNKLREKFNGCHGDYELPIIIAVQTRWDSGVDEFDFLNSLYGPLQFGFSSDKQSGELVEEGASRSVEKAFFYQPDVDCISAVARIGPSDFHDSFISGGLYRPIKIPRHPINSKLRVRLRDALFGPVPKRLVGEMSSVPGITTQEAEMLVKHGVDDISFFAAGMIDFPNDLHMERKRFEELRQEAKRLALIERSGRIEFLKSAQGVDLAPLHSQGIYTINQLLKHDRRPVTISEETWQAFRHEALNLKDGTPH